jgi:uncharacterized phage protein (TIGR01671 family)
VKSRLLKIVLRGEGRVREIKFRAWDIDEKCWIPKEMFVIGANGKLYTHDDNEEVMLEEVIPVELMQYTGLRDKNGKEIYEGDILRVLEVSNTNELEYRSPVEYIDCCFLVTEPSGTQVPLACFHNPDWTYPLFEIEIISNIYQNPDLLEVTP